MPRDRLLRILARLSSGDPAEPDAARLCEVCADVALMSGAGIMLMTPKTPQGSVCSSNEVSALIEELQFTLGEGPCIDACTLDRPVLEPDLDAPRTRRWIAFTPAAVGAGARAVFGFPLHVGAVRLGALNLYRDQTGPLNDEQYADCLVLAGVAAQSVLSMQALAPPGALAAELEKGASGHFVVHQAAGMVSAQAGIGVAEAMVWLRAHAFSHDRLITEVSRDVVDRILRFDRNAPLPDGV